MKRKEFLFSIDDLDILVSVKNILKETGIKNVSQLRKFSLIQLACLRGIGGIAMRQIDTAVKSLRLKLKRGSFRNFRRYVSFWEKRNVRVK